MRSRSAIALRIQELLSRENVDPRTPQYVFLIPLVLDVAQRVRVVDLPLQYLIALALVATATLSAEAIGRGLMSHRWSITLPMLDIVALGLMQSPDYAVAVALILPSIWLGLQFGGQGVLVTALTVLVAVVLPRPSLYGATAGSYSWMIQLMLVAVLSSAVVALTAELWEAQSRELQARGVQITGIAMEMDRERRRNDAIVSSVNAGLLALDAKGRYQKTNPRQRDFLDLAYPEGHLGDAGQMGFVYAADGVTPVEQAELPTARVMRGEAFADYLVWVGAAMEDRRALAVSGTPVTDAEGVFSGGVLVYHDITELMRAARIKDEFVATVSHELRTPLTSIIGYVDLIAEDGVLGEESRHHLAVVSRNARRLHRLVDDLLSTALDSVSTSLDIAPVDVAELVTNAAAEAQQAADAQGLSLTCMVEPTGLLVSGDGERLAQVLDNLFSNAIKYTDAGGRVHGTVERDGHQAVVRITDTGCGVASNEVGIIFDKFFRASSMTHQAIPGVGLGLAICKRIVEAHGGSVGVRSQLGEGSTFEVRLPLMEPAAALPEPLLSVPEAR